MSEEFTAPAAISECEPIVQGSRVVYYAADGGTVGFYTIDADTGAFDKKIYRKAGDNATWDFSNGVLTVSGTGAMAAGQDTPAWNAIESQVEKIVIKTGITEISNYAFAYLSNLKTVEIEEGVTAIGSRAFFACSNLASVTVPVSVAVIGDEAFATGYYWVGSNAPVVYATIYCADIGL